ncbi:unnamed protein product [Tuber aestivum]|uniref:Trafficking protein particle complex subunit n=1 Tax=Tuber aestivum TaxID=59557 RepID=A0A292PVB9_9PEZI|nr:unnamed protein product [Tuber aestivum]
MPISYYLRGDITNPPSSASTTPTTMTIYSFYIFDRHCECIYIKQWHQRDRTFRPTSSATSTVDSPVTLSSDRHSAAGSKLQNEVHPSGRGGRLSVQDDAKLVFGVVFSLRNMVRKLSGPDDSFISYRTGSYKLHYYETATNLKFVLLTDVKTSNLKVVLHQIYVNLYVEFGGFCYNYSASMVCLLFIVTKNPLSPIEHPGGEGVAVELFEMGLDSFIVSYCTLRRVRSWLTRLGIENNTGLTYHSAIGYTR